ncbi:uncharacterized protein ATNIH1004_002014 [Aspergillus tanneri]|uniref:Phospholipase D n=1 Tax=Aspergillus tanneri TaxID=1220188 RepID=A0A5M9M6Y9_9EURO|nr:uncharacterized protein ATNIH1004_002014 [Aspergillus tanneri]KAA8641346.1 hypothetical protein ATNIH1004_002014 [Aspergillus tanneri]
MLLKLCLIHIIPFAFLLAGSCSGESILEQTVLQSDSRRPIYLIAHRVLHASAVPQALSDGANALEVDVAPYNGVWPQDTVEKLFSAVAAQHKDGKPITFLWLDIKHPGHCSSAGNECIITELQQMAQKKLKSVGVRVLYGFSLDHSNSGAWETIAKNLTANEAMGLNARLNRPSIHSLERDRAKPRRPRIGKVFGWTITDKEENTDTAGTLLGFAKVDGLIYGEVLSHYRDNESNRIAIREIKKWLWNNSKTHRAAGQGDSPW